MLDGWQVGESDEPLHITVAHFLAFLLLLSHPLSRRVLNLCSSLPSFRAVFVQKQLYFTFDPGLTVTVNFIFTLREPNVYKPHGFFLGFLATFICFCVTVLFYRYLYFVVNQIKLQS